MLPRRLSQPLDPHLILDAFPERKLVHYKRNDVVYGENDAADAVYYVESGNIKITRVSPVGKEAVVALASGGDFVGESCLIGVPIRQGSAVCISHCKLWRISNEAVLARLRGDKVFAELFMAYLLDRNRRYQDDLADQLFNSTEKRLARALLLLAHLGTAGDESKVVPAVSHETLAGMVGMTRA